MFATPPPPPSLLNVRHPLDSSVLFGVFVVVFAGVLDVRRCLRGCT